MEKADNVFVYPSEFGWSDLGTWGSLYSHLKLIKIKMELLAIMLWLMILKTILSMCQMKKLLLYKA